MRELIRKEIINWKDEDFKNNNLSNKYSRYAAMLLKTYATSKNLFNESFKIISSDKPCILYDDTVNMFIIKTDIGISWCIK